MGVIIHDTLAKRLASRTLFVANDVCIGGWMAYKISSSVMKVQMHTDYRCAIGGLNTLSCLPGEVFSFTGSTFVSSPEGPCPGYAGPILSVDAGNHSFNVGFDMGGTTTFDGITGAFSFHSPVVLGLFGMFHFAHVELYTGDVPSATDDLNLLSPACALIPITHAEPFDEDDFGTYANMLYDAEQNRMYSSTALYGTAFEDGIPTWIKMTTYCRERTLHSEIVTNEYSIIIPVQGNTGVEIQETELVTGNFVTLHGLSVLF